jgi:SagB-type dehydrogenase family enzyme
MRLKVTQNLIAYLDSGRLRIVEVFSQKEISCDVETIYWLAQFSEWVDPDSVCTKHPEIDPTCLVEQFELLAELGFLLREGSVKAARELQKSRQWNFAPAATMFHFSTQNLAFMSLEESRAAQIEKSQLGDPPQLYAKSDSPSCRAIALLPDASNPLLGLMAKRRTIRQTKSSPIHRQALSDCLFAGLGITGFAQGSAELLPMKMTPSGGARNPYEAYVFVQDVDGLDSGVYHYIAVSGELERVGNAKGISHSELLGGQDWAEDKPVTIVLVAWLERTMWKYSDDNGYKVVLIEAGHIAQNIALAATAHQLTACPTAALAHDLIKAKLQLTKLTHTPIYAICLGKPDPIEPGIMPNRLSALPIHQGSASLADWLV